MGPSRRLCNLLLAQPGIELLVPISGDADPFRTRQDDPSDLTDLNTVDSEWLSIVLYEEAKNGGGSPNFREAPCAQVPEASNYRESVT
jgi:hypothetical protein